MATILTTAVSNHDIDLLRGIIQADDRIDEDRLPVVLHSEERVEDSEHTRPENENSVENQSYGNRYLVKSRAMAMDGRASLITWPKLKPRANPETPNFIVDLSKRFFRLASSFLTSLASHDMPQRPVCLVR